MAALPTPGSGKTGLLHAPPDKPPHNRSRSKPRPKPLYACEPPKGTRFPRGSL